MSEDAAAKLTATVVAAAAGQLAALRLHGCGLSAAQAAACAGAVPAALAAGCGGGAPHVGTVLRPGLLRPPQQAPLGATR
jgi:hypothetical protein